MNIGDTKGVRTITAKHDRILLTRCECGKEIDTDISTWRKSEYKKCTHAKKPRKRPQRRSEINTFPKNSWLYIGQCKQWVNA